MKLSTSKYHLENNVVITNLLGDELLNFPILNKGTAFTEEERILFHLEGLLPPHVDTMDEQVNRCYGAFKEKDNALQKHIYLRQLQDFNETLFYRLILDHLEEMLPIIYTPTVGDACQLFSHIYRRPRGLFFSYPNRKNMSDILNNFPLEDVKVIVVTDGERILGLGDQGAGGMGIPVGKLSLYSACGGINPMHTLPILLDVGTNNEKLHTDPTYLGWCHERITGQEYYDFVDEFVTTVIKKFPHVLLQFEDFAQTHAYPLLEKYRDRLCCFNDDIQGTASVTVAAVLSAVKSLGSKLSQQRIAVLGGGSAGCGISEQLVQAMLREGLSEKEARARFYLVDRDGLLVEGYSNLQPFQQGLVQAKAAVSQWQLQKSNFIGLEDVMQNAKPTILLGVSGQPGLFTEEIIRTMAEHTPRPIIFPMSNPTTRCEAKPEDLIRWTKGQALIATGSPFADVHFEGEIYPIAQCNNSYIFPGMGLGVIASGATRVSDAMFMAASIALSEQSPAVLGKAQELLPSLQNIRAVSRAIAVAVAKQAMREGVAKTKPNDELKTAIDATMWYPQYHSMKLGR